MIERTTAAIFGIASSMRRKRIFHPHGAGFELTLTVDQPGRYDEAALFAQERTWRGVARLSRALGLPHPVPDILGLAVRIQDAYGADRHQDFLLATSGVLPGLQHALLPGPRGFLGHTFSSLLPYAIGDQTRIVRADPVAGSTRGRIDLPDLQGDDYPSPLTFDLTLNTFSGRGDVVGRITTGVRLDDSETEALAFNPWNCGGGIRPVGPFQRWRLPSYLSSQSGRGVNPQGQVGNAARPVIPSRARARV